MVASLPTSALVAILIPIIAGAGVGIVATLVGSLITQRRERAQWHWQREYELLSGIESDVGLLSERLRGYTVGPNDWPEVGAQCLQLRHQVGRLYRHPRLQMALRDFEHTAAILCHERGQFDSLDERKQMLSRLAEQAAEVFAETAKALK